MTRAPNRKAEQRVLELCSEPLIHTVGDLSPHLISLGMCEPAQEWTRHRAGWALSRAYGRMARLDWLVWLYSVLRVPRALYAPAVRTAAQDAGTLVPLPLALRWAAGDGYAGADICALALRAAGADRAAIGRQLARGRGLRMRVDDHFDRGPHA